jgi:exosome complex component RRP40
MEPELDCINPATAKADGFGELKEGFMFKCSLGLCRRYVRASISMPVYSCPDEQILIYIHRLLDPDNPVLHYLGNVFAFETAVGLNGRVWVNAPTPPQVVVAVNTIKGSEGIPPHQAKEYVQSCVKALEDRMEED